MEVRVKLSRPTFIDSDQIIVAGISINTKMSKANRDLLEKQVNQGDEPLFL